ncbi:RluA family pseudouridine synthase [Candidatus Dojkabacteria bacterium]|nr:RluA family pseudouridine synthase [Candidatus Dojkabacteria bacterium]
MEVKRLDILVFSYLKSRNSIFGVSREKAIQLIKQGCVSVNGSVILQPSRKFRIKFDKIDIVEPKQSDIKDLSDNLLRNELVICENPLFLCINKPVSISVHPGAGKETDTIYSRFELSPSFDIKNKVNSGIIHRLDKETSGCLILAKDVNFASYLAQQFQKRRVTKYYVAVTPNLNEKNILEGFLRPKQSMSFDKVTSFINNEMIKSLEEIESDTLDSNDVLSLSNYFCGKLGRVVKLTRGWGIGGWVYREDRQRYTFSLEYPKTHISIPKSTVTLLFPIAEADNSLIWLIRILTGRTHQIRTVMKFLNAPIVGDNKYNSKGSKSLKRALGVTRMMLHAFYIKFLITAPFSQQLSNLGTERAEKSSNLGSYKQIYEKDRIAFSVLADFQ